MLSEPRFEQRRRLLGLFLGPLLLIIAAMVGPPSGVPSAGMLSLGIFLWTITWWILEPMPIQATAFLSMALLVLCGIFPLERAFGYWANWVNIFLIGAFIIGQAMNIHGLNRRFAYRMLSFRFIRGDPWRLLLMFLTGTALLSTVASNVVTTLIFMAVGLGLLESLKVERGGPLSTSFIMCVAWAADLGGIVTPVGTPPNMIAIGLLEPLGYRVGFLKWTMVGFPVMALGMAAMFLIIRFVIRPEMKRLQVPAELIAERAKQLGPMSRGEKISAAALSSALILWVLPDILSIFLGQGHKIYEWLQARLSWSVVAILVAMALFLIPLDRETWRPAITWTEAVKGIEWGTLAFIAAALALGDAIGSPTVGLGNLFSRGAAAMADLGTSPYLFAGTAVAFTIFLTNFISNNAAVSITGPIALSIASNPGSNINPIALVVAIGMGSSMAFALPSATPPVALVFASGQVNRVTMLKSGALLALISVFIVTFLGYGISSWLFPWPP